MHSSTPTSDVRMSARASTPSDSSVRRLHTWLAEATFEETPPEVQRMAIRCLLDLSGTACCRSHDPALAHHSGSRRRAVRPGAVCPFGADPLRRSACQPDRCGSRRWDDDRQRRLPRRACPHEGARRCRGASRAARSRRCVGAAGLRQRAAGAPRRRVRGRHPRGDRPARDRAGLPHLGRLERARSRRGRREALGTRRGSPPSRIRHRRVSRAAEPDDALHRSSDDAEGWFGMGCHDRSQLRRPCRRADSRVLRR